MEKIFLSVFSFLLPVNLYCQIRDLKLDHVGADSSLSQNYVTCIMQDCKGFMWIGTGDGLNEFSEHQIVLEKSSSIYVDQFEGRGLEKFSLKRFSESLIINGKEPVSRQQEIRMIF